MSWDIVKLDSIFDISRGGSPRPINDYLTDDIDGINWIMIGDTESGQKYINSTAKKIKKEGVSKSRAVHKGDFLLTNSMSFGRPYILNIDGCIHDGWLVLSPINENLSKDYFYFYLGSNEIKSRLASMAAGAVVKNLNKDLVKSLKIPFPPLEEQKKIAAILDAADAYRQKTKALIDKYDQLTQSLFLDMFGDPVTNPKEWRLSPLGEAIDVRDGTHDSPKYIHEGYPLITSKNIVDGKLNFNDVNLISKSDFDNINKRSKVDYGDIIMPMIGTIGNPVEVLTTKSFAIKNVALFKKNTDSPLLIPILLMLLKGHYLLHYSHMNNRGGTQKFLSLGAIRKMPVFLPPLQLQNQFAERVEQIEKQKQQAEASLVKAEELFSSLLQRAFKGELTS